MIPRFGKWHNISMEFVLVPLTSFCKEKIEAHHKMSVVFSGFLLLHMRFPKNSFIEHYMLLSISTEIIALPFMIGTVFYFQ